MGVLRTEVPQLTQEVERLRGARLIQHENTERGPVWNCHRRRHVRRNCPRPRGYVMQQQHFNFNRAMGEATCQLGNHAVKPQM